ncbi:unnamed protein product [Lactuca virosa]|uniref:Mechanosensitive ion channel MscS domain-containing protein n=1 Tax=Lactuca virosa TaxID=75947 RepID=A0AAU9LU65_9ASTR|nr:unnamed protein product [Lactuca virosa]
MNGISLVISKPCCPMYNFGTSKKIDLNQHRLSKLNLQRISLPISTTRMLKHRVYSLSALQDKKGDSRSEVPKVVGVVVRGIIGIALVKRWVFIAQSISTVGAIGGLAKHVEVVVLSSLTLGGILDNFGCFFTSVLMLSNILEGFAAVRLGKHFSIGDIIEVGWLQAGSVKGQVIKSGLITTTLLSEESSPILVANYAFCSQIFVQVDEIEKIHEISEEIINMMKSNSNVYLKGKQPYCQHSKLEGYCIELTLGCYLKKMCEAELRLVKQDILLQSAQIIKKHGATLW